MNSHKLQLPVGKVVVAFWLLTLLVLSSAVNYAHAVNNPNSVNSLGIPDSRDAKDSSAPGPDHRSAKDPPSSRYYPAMAYDTADGYVVLFGGYGSTELGDTWAFKNGAWTQMFPSVSPSPRSGATMVYDAADGYVLLFGGVTTSPSLTYFSDTWKFKAGVWTQLTPSTSPSARTGVGLVFDSAHGYVLLFAGAAIISGSPVYYGDTWSFKRGNWNHISTRTSPPARTVPGLTFDQSDGYVLLFGGYSVWTSYLADTWRFTGKNWVQLHPATSPSARAPNPLSYDFGDGYVLLFGGRGTDGITQDTWAFKKGVWTFLNPSIKPVARYYTVLTFDFGDGYAIMFGGIANNDGVVGDTWSFKNGGWTQVA